MECNKKKEYGFNILEFSDFFGLTWIPPRYRRTQKLPFIPRERDIDQLIAGCSKTVSTFLQILKETGGRSIEA